MIKCHSSHVSFIRLYIKGKQLSWLKLKNQRERGSKGQFSWGISSWITFFFRVIRRRVSFIRSEGVINEISKRRGFTFRNVTLNYYLFAFCIISGLLNLDSDWFNSINWRLLIVLKFAICVIYLQEIMLEIWKVKIVDGGKYNFSTLTTFYL